VSLDNLTIELQSLPIRRSQNLKVHGLHILLPHPHTKLIWKGVRKSVDPAGLG